ncbi:MAG TPA: 3-hydroxyacyl-ACP dehydratase FabZ family protein [Chthoniobacterales bacterium]
MDPLDLGLPHREPFVFIEAVEAHEPGLMAIATKTFSGHEPFFQGHFPGNPVVPGVLLAEGMAQTAGVAVADRDHVFLLTAIQSMKFLRPVRPKERVVFSARLSGAFQALFMCDVKAEVADEVVAEGRVVLTRGPGVEEQRKA